MMVDPVSGTTYENAFSMDASGGNARVGADDDPDFDTSFTVEMFMKLVGEPTGYHVFLRRREANDLRWQIDFDHAAKGAFGRLRYQQGDFAETARLWEKSIELDPEFLYPIVLTPQVYTSLGLEDEVNRSLRRIVVASERHLELNPDDYGARLVVASALLELGERVDEAMLWASVVLASDTDDALTLYNLACFYSKAENVDKALESLERAVTIPAVPLPRYHDAAWVRQDSDLNNIRDDPHFGIVLDRMEQMSAGNEDTDS